MGIEEAIVHLEKVVDAIEGKPVLAELFKPQIIREAVALLKTHPEAKPNEPLTLEELREMDGQPVWTYSDIFPDDCGCRVVKKAGVLDVEITDRRCFNLTDFGKSWLAYRRPPKEERR